MAALNEGGGRYVRRSSGVAFGKFVGHSRAWRPAASLVGNCGCYRCTALFVNTATVAAVYSGYNRNCLTWRLYAMVQEALGRCSCRCSVYSYTMEVLVRRKVLLGVGKELDTGSLLNPRNSSARWYCFGVRVEQELAEEDAAAAAGSLMEGNSPNLAEIDDGFLYCMACLPGR